MMAVCGKSLVLCLALLVSIGSSETLLYVQPTSATICPGQPCLTLDQYMENSARYITSNTVFKLLPGQHMLSRPFVVQDVENVTIEPENEDTVIQYRDPNPVVLSSLSSRTFTSGAALRVINCVNVTVRGIDMHGVGIYMEESDYVTLFHVTVNSTRSEFGLYLNATNHTTLNFTSINNSGKDGVRLYKTRQTRIFNTSVSDAAWNGLTFINTTHSIVSDVLVESPRRGAIVLLNTLRSTIMHTTVNNPRGTGITVQNTVRTKLLYTLVSNTGSNGRSAQHNSHCHIMVLCKYN